MSKWNAFENKIQMGNSASLYIGLDLLKKKLYSLSSCTWKKGLSKVAISLEPQHFRNGGDFGS